MVQSHPQFAEIESRLRMGDRVVDVAKAYDLNYDTLKSWWKRHRDDTPAPALVEVSGDFDDIDAELDRAQEIIQRAEARGLKVASVALEAGESEWDGWSRDDVDDPATSARQTAARRKAMVKLAAPTASDDTRLEIRQAEPIEVTFKVPSRLPRRIPSNRKWAAVFPDAQRPFEDHAAVDVCLQILADLEAEHGVDTIVHLGDDLDLPDFGKHRTAPAALGMVQEGVDRQYQILATERAIAPNSEIFWLQGNHEQRLLNWMVDVAPQLIGLRRAGDESEDPAISLESLCRINELNVKMVGPYPEGEVWLNSHFRLVHGDIAKSAKGQTAAAYLAAGHMSTAYGHIHRAELVYQTRHTPNGPRTYLAGSPGCLCRIDGKVPSAKTGINANGSPGMNRPEDWQHGMWVVSYETSGSELYDPEPIHIWGGRATWRGRDYVARVNADGTELAEAS
jgi:transposase-like protein